MMLLTACLLTLAADAEPDARDASVLVEVSINPESRVKAARGPAKATLKAGAAVPVRVKVVNEGGVRAVVRVRSPQAGPDGFLTIMFPSDRPLSGGPVDYVEGTLQCAANVTGKREVTLIFDVGQGTQDLGFRAELPILFGVQR
jgi:hypothetical protein